MLMTLERASWLRRRGHLVRVLLEGADVTSDCQCADDSQGWALLLQRDDRGKACLANDHTGLAKRIATGHVVVQVRLWAARRRRDAGASPPSRRGGGVRSLATRGPADRVAAPEVREGIQRVSWTGENPHGPFAR
jgi:hypothetical protein